MGTLHPLGRGASPAENQRTKHNREAVAACLREAYACGLGAQINRPITRHCSRTGAELANRFVSRLELDYFLGDLRKADALHFLLLEWLYDRNLTVAECARRLQKRPATVIELRNAALDYLVERIFWDEEGR